MFFCFKRFWPIIRVKNDSQEEFTINFTCSSHGIYVLLRLSQDFVVRKLVRKQEINIHAACVPKTWGIVQLYCHLQFLICLKQFYWLKSKWRNHLHSDDNPLEKEQRKIQTNIRKVIWFDLWHENQWTRKHLGSLWFGYTLLCTVLCVGTRVVVSFWCAWVVVLV